MEDRPTIKHQIYDSVFIDLLKTDDYLERFWHAIDPSAPDIPPKVISTENVITNGIYNDIVFTAGDDAVVLAEAQSTWSGSMPLRMMGYFSRTMMQLAIDTDQRLYGPSPVRLPHPKFYVLYTGPKRRKQPPRISFRETFFPGRECDVDLIINMVYGGRKNDIVYQYTEFARITREYFERFGRTEDVLVRAIKECMEHDILRDYLMKRRGEVMNLRMQEAVQEFEYLMFLQSEKAASHNEGMTEGIQKGHKVGLAEGIQKGHKVGLAEGIEKGNHDSMCMFAATGKFSLDEMRGFYPDIPEDEIRAAMTRRSDA